MKYVPVFGIYFLLTASCKPSGDGYEHVAVIDKSRLVSINKYLANKDFDIMRHYVKRKSWKMSFSGDGYFYEILNEGECPKIADRKQVTFDGSISLLDGTRCYDIKNRVFVVGGSEEIHGLHHAVKYLGNGGEARFIFPSHLAYGIQGDFNKIPSRAILLYSVHVTDVR
jgi:FKBP-type peptidyl-prolyl cis-trans isomerase